MSYKHTTSYKRKYKFDSFDFTVPEFIELLKEKAEVWVRETNEYRTTRRAEMVDPNEYTKKEIKQNINEIKENPEWYAPVTIQDYVRLASYDCTFRIPIDPATGTFNITMKTEMTYMDKLKGAVEKKQLKETLP